MSIRFRSAEYRNGSDSLPYQLHAPKFDGSHPLLICLHGAGERGTDNQLQLRNFQPLFDRADLIQQAPIILVPQCPPDRYWGQIEMRKKLFAGIPLDFEETFQPPSREMELLQGLIEQTIQSESVDRKRIYLVGHSMGGFGTLELLARNPKNYTAAVATCSGGSLRAASLYASHVPVYLTHGEADEIVSVRYSRELFEKLKSLRAEVLYTEFSKVDHNSWTPTYHLPELVDWLFSHKQ